MRSQEELEAFGVRVLNRAVERILEGRTCACVQEATRCNGDDRPKSAKGKQRASSQTNVAASTLMLAETPAHTATCVQQKPTPGESATRGDEDSLLDGQSVLPAGVLAFDNSSGRDGIGLDLLDNVDFNLELMRWTETDEEPDQFSPGFSLSG